MAIDTHGSYYPTRPFSRFFFFLFTWRVRKKKKEEPPLVKSLPSISVFYHFFFYKKYSLPLKSWRMWFPMSTDYGTGTRLKFCDKRRSTLSLLFFSFFFFWHRVPFTISKTRCVLFLCDSSRRFVESYQDGRNKYPWRLLISLPSFFFFFLKREMALLLNSGREWPGGRIEDGMKRKQIAWPEKRKKKKNRNAANDDMYPLNA